jgi:serine protease Do
MSRFDNMKIYTDPLARLIVIFLASITFARCTVSPQTHELREPMNTDLEIFDKRFRALSFGELSLDRFWIRAEEDAEREPVVLNNYSIADVVEKARKGVVNIYAQTVVEREVRFGISPNDLLPIKIPLVSSLLEILPFQVPLSQEEEGVSLGSGFIINAEGYILTNAHVINNAVGIQAVLSDGEKQYPAQIIGIDRLTDLALIKIDTGKPLFPLVLGNSDHLRTGELVLALGNPLGFKHTVTSGLISAKERVSPMSHGNVDFLQTDSAINPGSSGGPLLNMYGEVVGVNTAIIQKAQLLGFAIPIDTVKEIMPMLALGKTERGWFGAQAHPLSLSQANLLNLPIRGGMIVREVVSESPASKAGMKENDVIVSVNGTPIDSFVTFRRKLLGMPPGHIVAMEVFRDGKIIAISGTLEKQKVEAIP